MPSIVIAQGGGPTAVINQTLCGAIHAARRHDPSVRILGARYGVRGLTAGNVADLTTNPQAHPPASATNKKTLSFGFFGVSAPGFLFSNFIVFHRGHTP